MFKRIRMPEKHVIKHFAPSWFAVIMGTGGLANILFLWEGPGFGGWRPSMALASLADIGYVLVLVPWLLRWVNHYNYVRRDLHHPVVSNFFVTMPVATVILGTNICLIWSQFLPRQLVYSLALSCWFISILGVAFFTLFTTFRFIGAETAPDPEQMNFSWIMAPIANMALLLLGNPVFGMVAQRQPEWASTVLVANAAMFGIGFSLFIFVGAIIFVRLAQHPLPPAETTPTFGIFLSAAGLAISCLIDLGPAAKSLGLVADTGLFSLSAVCLWGFGMWILAIILVICVHQVRRGGFQFSLGWWAFVFPLAAYTIGSQKIAMRFPSLLTRGYAQALTILLVALWAYILLRTLRGLVQGTLFLGKPILDANI
jgi:C4-dicarboxylate transporter/malic acid transport protein